MIMRVLLTLFLTNILINICLAVPDCGNGGIVSILLILFTSQPRDIEVFEEVHNVAKFPCYYEGERSRQAHLQWIINSTVYDSQLPPDHQYWRNTHTLSVTNIKHWQNSTTYQCQVLTTFDEGQQCAFRSSIGRLIIKGFEVQIMPHYYTDSQKQEIMTEVSLSFSQVDSKASYDLIFTNLVSGEVCDSDVIPASSCVDGACNYIFKVPSSSCPINTDINVTVKISSSGLSKQIKIDSMNNFIKVIFHEATSSLALKFINQPKKSEKHYTVRYGVLDPSCRHLAIHTKGHLTNTNSISVELNIRPENTTTEFCLSVTVTNGTRTVSVEGIYTFGSRFNNHPIMAVVFVLIAIVLIVSVSLIFTVMLYRHYVGQLSRYKECGVDYVNRSEQNPVIFEQIDLSTTFYKLLTVTEECSIYEFGKKHFPDYQPHRGFGYYKLTDYKDQLYKRVIMTDNDVPTYTIARLSLVVKQQSNITMPNIYVQEKERRTLHPHDKFLYCARSKEITKIAYWKVFDVTQECKESSFIEEKFLGYNTDWIRYGYYEMTEPMYVEASQSFIILKKDGGLVKGPGVQHLLTTGTQEDNSTIVQPPNLDDHPEWQHVFVQSTDGDRQLTPSTKYLFCATMNRIDDNVYRALYTVDKRCTMEEFGRRFIPVFKADLGYGYFELAHEEYLKLHKNVIVMDKEGKLFTGAGAKFFYINCQCGKEEIELKRKVSPPDLEGTEWKHVFVQSQDKNRMLREGTLFLYCEYRTIEQL